MVQNSGKALCADTLKPINLPEPVDVEEGPSGLPAAVRKGRRQAVRIIDDRWRIDDEWWRSQPVSRVYYSLVLTSGQRMIIYKDLIQEEWFRQGY